GDCKEGHRPGTESERRNRYEGVGGIHIAANQEPGDERAEATSAQPPFVQEAEIALAPPCGGETEPGNEAEYDDENAQRHPVHALHRSPPLRSRFVGAP